MPNNTFYTQSGAKVLLFFDIRKQNHKKTMNISKIITFWQFRGRFATV